MDETITLKQWRDSVTPDSVDEMRRLGRTDLYFFAKVILGFAELSPRLHLDMCEFLTSPTLRKLLLIPRGHFKSTLATIAYPVWRIVNNPNIRILIVSASQKNAEDFLGYVSNILIGKKSEIFNQLYPEVLPTQDWLKYNKWNSQEITVPRSAMYAVGTVEAIGVGGGAAGRHHDIIIKDDLINEKTARSELEMQSVIEWHKTSDALFDVPENGLDIIVGTRWGAADYYDYIKDVDLRYELFYRQCYDIDGLYGTPGEPIFPERFSKESLEELQRVMGEKQFGLQYLNDPRFSSFGSLDVADLKYYTLQPDDYVELSGGEKVDLRQCNVYMLVDPARTKDKKGCKSAVVVLAVDWKGRIIVLEAWKAHANPDELTKVLFALNDRWHPKKCVIEGVGYQTALITLIDKVGQIDRKRFCPTEAIYPRGGDGHTVEKGSRIEGMGQYARKGQVYIQSTMKDFITEWVNFGLKKDVDLLDAFAYGPRVWQLPLSPAQRADRITSGFGMYGRRTGKRGYR